MNEFYYFDHAATTPVDPAVVEAMLPWFTEHYTNPSATYSAAHTVRAAVDDARKRIAGHLGAANQEVVFTGGGTESIAIALHGVMATAPAGANMVVSSIEHSAVKESAAALAAAGVEVRTIPVTRDGMVDLAAARKLLDENTALVSVMLANNEIGTIQPVAQVVETVRELAPNALVHTDACQATGAVPINVQELGVDLLTINASKIYGPKGVGALYVRKGVTLTPLVHGGDQERGLRPGTENVPGIIGFAKAMDLVIARAEQENPRLVALRDRLIAGILERIPDTELNGDPAQRLPNNANILIRGVDGEALLFSLDQEGIAASLGSACTAGSIEPSHVLQASGRSQVDARRSLRLTLGKDTTDAAVDAVLEALPGIVERLRNM